MSAITMASEFCELAKVPAGSDLVRLYRPPRIGSVCAEENEQLQYTI